MASLWGEEHDNKMLDFDNQVEAIELKYFDVFKDQINRISGKSPDKLRNHFITQWDSQKRSIGFSKHTYVPKYIQDEVIAAWLAVFDTK